MRNTVIVEGIGDLRDVLGMVLEDGWVMDPPEPIMRMVEVPGRSGSLDLTEAMGGPFFSDRYQSFTFGIFGDDHEVAARRAIGALHGRRLRYSVSMDPDYTYEGRWSLSQIGRDYRGLTTIVADVVAGPYRSRRDVTLRLNPAGGREYWLESGDMPVRPTVECRTVTLVEWSGETFELTPGTYVLRGEPMRRGLNRLWLNSQQSGGTTMGYLSGLTMGELSIHRMAELRWLSRESGTRARTMGELSTMRMGELSDMTMRDVRWGPGEGGAAPSDETAVIVTYGWGDL